MVVGEAFVVVSLQCNCSSNCSSSTISAINSTGDTKNYLICLSCRHIGDNSSAGIGARS